MLLSYKFYTFSQPFSQIPNKFYGRKFQNIHLTQPKIKIKTPFIHELGERRKKEWEIEGKRGSEWMEAAAARSGGFGGGVGLVVRVGQISDWWWRPNRPVHWRAWWSTACGRLSRLELNLYLSVHGWRSERWVLGVCGSLMREGWAEIFQVCDVCECVWGMCEKCKTLEGKIIV